MLFCIIFIYLLRNVIACYRSCNSCIENSSSSCIECKQNYYSNEINSKIYCADMNTNISNCLLSVESDCILCKQNYTEMLAGCVLDALNISLKNQTFKNLVVQFPTDISQLCSKSNQFQNSIQIYLQRNSSIPPTFSNSSKQIVSCDSFEVTVDIPIKLTNKSFIIIAFDEQPINKHTGNLMNSISNTSIYIDINEDCNDIIRDI